LAHAEGNIIRTNAVTAELKMIGGWDEVDCSMVAGEDFRTGNSARVKRVVVPYECDDSSLKRCAV